MSDVFDELVGQEPVVATLRQAAADAAALRAGATPTGAMTHAWLITGPPGSGRSTAALAFAAALVCPRGGCGQCEECTAVRHSAHVDVEHVVPEAVEYSVDEARELIARSALAPARSPWHVFVLEDTDRLNDASGNTLLKSIEEPPPGTVWLLCAPSTEDVLPTIRSRCRHLLLATPTSAQVATALTEKFGIDPATAAFAARAAQGHIGRARALATDAQARERRATVLRLPTSLGSLGDCLQGAAELVETVTADTAAYLDPLEESERAQLLAAYGKGGEGKGIGTAERRARGNVKAMEDRHKKRRRRVVRDQLDRTITDLVAFYRDVLVLQLAARSDLVNDELRPVLEQLAAEGSAEQTLRRVDALERARGLLEANVPPLLTFESLLVALKDPTVAA
ncbi:MAG TPA: DNA polymerase III subunit delta' [Candidatus Nanopelagicales bacterium]|jgi:DNA polymerase-3 subunit delta'|nr:DNA polymerase III subunit delta' [Candidatus Nanopelagicales bacterium]